MGKKKITEVTGAEETTSEKPVKKTKKVAQAASADQTVQDPAVQVNKAEKTADQLSETAESSEEEAQPVKKQKVRGKKYVMARGQVDKTKLYSIAEAVALVKKTKISKFDGVVEAHLVVREEGLNVQVEYPHSTGRTVKVAIVTDELLADLEKGVIDFTTLVTHPSMMPKVAKFARLLGPKGLMPNPKNGTVTPDPEKRKKELEGGAVSVKTERKAPLVHTTIGKISQSEQELSANLEALLKAFPAGKVVKCAISATMGPGVKVTV